jgi:8-oxo-dGTP diphosphatase
LWNLPGGRVEVGESIGEAAFREVKEETGYSVNLTAKVAIFHEGVMNIMLKHVFAGEVTDGDLELFRKMRSMDAQWFSFEEMESMRDRIRMPWVLGSEFAYIRRVIQGFCLSLNNKKVLSIANF